MYETEEEKRKKPKTPYTVPASRAWFVSRYCWCDGSCRWTVDCEGEGPGQPMWASKGKVDEVNE